MDPYGKRKINIRRYKRWIRATDEFAAECTFRPECSLFYAIFDLSLFYTFHWR